MLSSSSSSSSSLFFLLPLHPFFGSCFHAVLRHAHGCIDTQDPENSPTSLTGSFRGRTMETELIPLSVAIVVIQRVEKRVPVTGNLLTVLKKYPFRDLETR